MSETSQQALLVEVEVKLRLREYLQTLLDYLPFELRRRALLKGEGGERLQSLPWHYKALVCGFGPLAFLYKVSRIGTCRFRIDDRSVKRTSKLGELVVPWQEVTGVLKVSGAYMIQKEIGAMPIPYRCMSELERFEFERLAGSKLSAVQAEA